MHKTATEKVLQDHLQLVFVNMDKWLSNRHMIFCASGDIKCNPSTTARESSKLFGALNLKDDSQTSALSGFCIEKLKRNGWELGEFVTWAITIDFESKRRVDVHRFFESSEALIEHLVE